MSSTTVKLLSVLGAASSRVRTLTGSMAKGTELKITRHRAQNNYVTLSMRDAGWGWEIWECCIVFSLKCLNELYQLDDRFIGKGHRVQNNYVTLSMWDAGWRWEIWECCIVFGLKCLEELYQLDTLVTGLH